VANNEKLVISAEEASKILNLSRNGTYSALQRGDLPSIRIGKRILIPTAALQRLLDSADKPKG
jgi:excisionase family DNA binding protein